MRETRHNTLKTSACTETVSFADNKRVELFAAGVVKKNMGLKQRTQLD